ncbi:MAG: DUF3800 domain-containing protein [Ilumatobacteraceae bacterium]
MLLAYVDESYSKRRYWIAAMVYDDASASALVADLDGLVERAAVAYGISPGAELHGYDLFHAKRDWAPMKGKTRALISVYAHACEAIGRSSADIIVRGVDLDRLQARYSNPETPHSIVLAHMLERIHDRARQRGQHALVIADEIDGADQHQRALQLARSSGTTGYRARRLDRIVDTIHFVPSRSSRLLQAADLVAFIVNRRDGNIARHPDERATLDRMWERVSGRVTHMHCWSP